MHTYTTIAQQGHAEFKDRGSKFIGYALPIENITDFKAKLEEIKQLHPKATHHCYAYRLGLDKNLFRANDDGEPSGSAGKPILGQIDSAGLTNVLVVVVRYYGGTMLGVPGLINAYKNTAAFALQVTPKVSKEVFETFSVDYDYTQMNDVLRFVKECRGVILKNDTALFAQLKVNIPLVEAEKFKNYMVKNRFAITKG
jgi:uncharacterized YigZ family protein